MNNSHIAYQTSGKVYFPVSIHVWNCIYETQYIHAALFFYSVTVIIMFICTANEHSGYNIFGEENNRPNFLFSGSLFHVNLNDLNSNLPSLNHCGC